MSLRPSTSSSGSKPVDLDELVAAFAGDLTATISALVPTCAPFTVETSPARGKAERVSIRQEPNTGIPLAVAGKPLLDLKVLYLCSLDHELRYLAVEESEIVVRAVGDSEPLLRFEYVHNPRSSDIPHAHIQVHAHRDAFGYLMGKAGTATKRGRRRANSSGTPRLSELHLPVGGPRFRPCLEDVLEVLVHEFGIDSTAGGLEALRRGRERWRRMQTATVVRDAPEEAARVLRDIGYAVNPPEHGVPRDNTARLQCL